MITTSTIADALQIPVRFRRGATQIERVASIDRIADPLLGVDRDAGEVGWIRTEPIAGHLFVTKSNDDTLYFPLNSPRRGQPRYNWVTRGDGIRLGYLTPDARDTPIEPFDPIAAGLHLPL